MGPILPLVQRPAVAHIIITLFMSGLGIMVGVYCCSGIGQWYTILGKVVVILSFFLNLQKNCN